ncbi:MAG: DUF6065 family protein [Xanthobacteraceae bacterium]
MRFYRILPYGADPILPPDELSGEVPIRAYRFCEPFLAANRVGWLLYPPTNFELIWTGREFLVKFDTIDSWIKVDKLFLPEFADYWSDTAPAAAADMIPPFLEAFPERGVIQVWSGFVIETEPGVSTWIRGPVNRNSPGAYHVLEAIVETDWWMGPLFTNIQFTKTDDPVRFENNRPWLQLIEVPRAVHLARKGEQPTVVGMSEATWSKFMEASDRRNKGQPGSYRLESKRRIMSESTRG